MNKANNTFSHDHFNTWQTCAMRYYFKYIKKLNYPDFAQDYELGRNFHALVDYHLRGFEIDDLLKHASEDVQDCWNLIKDNPLLGKKLVKTEWGFNSRIGESANWLVGRIDAIFYDSERKKYIIADWKTGKYVPKNIESNFQHKIYLYAFYKSQKDLGLEFKPEDIEFQYVKVKDDIFVNTIEFSKEKLLEYEKRFLHIIQSIHEKQDFTPPATCPLEQCLYKNLCFNYTGTS